MEQIKLHKQGGAAVIIIPASMIENTGWEDGTLLEVLEINETLHIRRKTESGALATKACPSLFSSTMRHVNYDKIIRYNSGLNLLMNCHFRQEGSFLFVYIITLKINLNRISRY